MNKPRPCGCKGHRSCLICEKEYKIHKLSPRINKENNVYVYCPLCNLTYPGWDIEDNEHPDHKGEAVPFPGIYVDLTFLSSNEERELLSGIYEMPWDLSQSGRRKQNFGPKCNFKKRKIKSGEFEGFPLFSKFVQDKFESIPILKNFQTIEQCSLEYDPSRGASIDPHVDDCWIWGERVVTVNLLSDSMLTMTYNDKPDKYNLDCVRNYPKVVNKDNEFDSYKINVKDESLVYPTVRIPMPKRSLLVIYDSARYDWEHRVLREDVISKRVCLAYREFTPPYLEGGDKYEEGREVIDRSKLFWNHKDYVIE